MITTTRNGGSQVEKFAEFKGKSTDIKPTGEGIPNGSEFFEMDTGEVYFYDAEIEDWILPI